MTGEPETTSAENPSTKARPLHPIWRLLLYLPVLAIAIFPVLLVFLALDSVFPFKEYNESRLTLNNAIITTATVLMGTWVCQRFLAKSDMKKLGLHFESDWIRELLLGTLIGLALAGLVFAVELLAGWIDVQACAWQTQSWREVSTLIFIGVMAALGTAIRTSVIVPGYLLQTLEEWKNLPFATVVVLVLLSGAYLAHNAIATETPIYFGPVIYIILSSILLILAYLIRRSLWLPIGLYFAWSFFADYIFALGSSQPKGPTLFITRVTGPTFWVRSQESFFGTDAGALDILIILLSIGAFWLILRRRNLLKDEKTA
jgi:hypothetical protein